MGVTVDEELRAITLKEEFEKNPECPVQNFHDIKNWLWNQDHLPKISDEKLFQFLFSCFYDVENTKKCIEIFYALKTNSPELFTNCDVSDAELQKTLSNVAVFTLPKLTPEKNYRITFLRIESDNSSNFDFAKTAKLFLMAYEAELYVRGTARGHVIVFDCKNIGFRHILKCGLEMWKKIIKLTQEALPVRKKTLHLLNTNYFVYKCVQFLKPFMRPEVFSTLHLHRAEDLEELYKFVPRECLPAEYDGCLQSVETYKKIFEQQLWKLRDHFSEDEKLVMKEQ